MADAVQNEVQNQQTLGALRQAMLFLLELIVIFIGTCIIISSRLPYRYTLIPWLAISLLYLSLGDIRLTNITFMATWTIFILFTLIFAVTPLRKLLFTQFLYTKFKKIIPPISDTERLAITCGDVWWEKEFFNGVPNWKNILSYNAGKLTQEETHFLMNEVETLCSMVDEWQSVSQTKDIDPKVWAYIKEKNFLGMVIPKEFGGLGFSAKAHSQVVSKIASKSISVAVTVMVPNSLGPGELLLHYGTDEQKKYWLPRLASGTEIPCFGLTEPEAGSDATAIHSSGEVCEIDVQGRKALAIKLNFYKRYITLAPIATCIGLAFKLKDPHHLLGKKADLGITCAVIPSSVKGVVIGPRHYPMNAYFMNGSIYGKDVLIPIDYVIGGKQGVGEGWKMLMESLSIGRSISLPALSTGISQVCYQTTTAYSRLRKQFGVAIGQFEGVQEKVAEIAGNTYAMNAATALTASAVDQKIKPAIASAIAKYSLTEMARVTINNAMDIHAGKGIQHGPNNYLANFYQTAPIAITVEGSNILTRNLIVFGQGVMRCHPHLFNEMELLTGQVSKLTMTKFDEELITHIKATISHMSKAFLHGVTGAKFIKVPEKKVAKRHLRHISRMSIAFSLATDISLLLLGGALKRKERLSARLADMLCNLYMASCTVKQFVTNGYKESEELYVDWFVQKALFEMQNSFNEICDNLPSKFIGAVIKKAVFPLGNCYKMQSDKKSQTLAIQSMKSSDVRPRLTSLVHKGSPEQPLALIENTFKLAIEVHPVLSKLNKALGKKFISTHTFDQQVAEGVSTKAISKEQGDLLTQFERSRKKIMEVDIFINR